jgi:Mg-chelatase subunit ChlD
MIQKRLYRRIFVVFLSMLLISSNYLLVGHDAFAADSDINVGDGIVVVSLGDSYSSGEGNEPFYGQNQSDYDKTHDSDWLAHRSEKAWPGMLQIKNYPTQGLSYLFADNKGTSWFFAASSGAETKHVYQSTQEKVYQLNFSGLFTEKGTATLPRQMDVFSDNGLNGKVDFVTITIGGNDLGFANIITTAITDLRGVKGGGLDNAVNEANWLYDTAVKDRLEETYNAIQTSAGNQAVIIVAGYPTLINKNGVGFDYTEFEAEKVNQGVTLANSKIETLVNDLYDSGLNIRFASVEEYFSGHEAYTQDPYINKVILGAQAQDLDHGLAGVASAYSMHPNEAGQKAYAKAVQAIIDGGADVSTSLVFDVSGSMADPSAYAGNSKLAAAKQQGKAFVESVKTQSDSSGLSSQVGIVSFSNSSYVDMNLTDDYSAASSAVDGLATMGSTNIYDGLNEGIRQLESTTGQKLMVFLSDGMSNVGGGDNAILDLAREAASKDIKIYTIGFGASSDLNESLLQQIASITGGEYAHEDPSSLTGAAVGIFATMMKAQLSATSKQILIDKVGAVAQGNTIDVGSFLVEANGIVQAYLYWPGSTLDLKLTDPDGIEVDENYPGYTVQSDSIPTQVSIEGAKEGEWNMSVYGAEVSMAEEPYFAIATFDETEAPEPPQESPQVVAAGGGGAQDDGSGLLIILVVVAVCAIGGVFAFTMRKKNGDNNSNTEIPKL